MTPKLCVEAGKPCACGPKGEMCFLDQKIIRWYRNNSQGKKEERVRVKKLLEQDNQEQVIRECLRARSNYD